MVHQETGQIINEFSNSNFIYNHYFTKDYVFKRKAVGDYQGCVPLTFGLGTGPPFGDNLRFLFFVSVWLWLVAMTNGFNFNSEDG